MSLTGNLKRSFVLILNAAAGLTGHWQKYEAIMILRRHFDPKGDAHAPEFAR